MKKYFLKFTSIFALVYVLYDMFNGDNKFLFIDFAKSALPREKSSIDKFDTLSDTPKLASVLLSELEKNDSIEFQLKNEYLNKLGINSDFLTRQQLRDAYKFS